MRQGTVDRAAIGDFPQPRDLIRAQVASDNDLFFEAVNFTVRSFAGRTIVGINTRVFQGNFDRIQRPAFATGVHPQRHRSAGPQRRH